jgi:hypothetical protein
MTISELQLLINAVNHIDTTTLIQMPLVVLSLDLAREGVRRLARGMRAQLSRALQIGTTSRRDPRNIGPQRV